MDGKENFIWKTENIGIDTEAGSGDQSVEKPAQKSSEKPAEKSVKKPAKKSEPDTLFLWADSGLPEEPPAAPVKPASPEKSTLKKHEEDVWAKAKRQHELKTKLEKQSKKIERRERAAKAKRERQARAEARREQAAQARIEREERERLEREEREKRVA